MRSIYKRLGQYIREVDIRNEDLAELKLLGVSIQKELMPSIANTIGTDMSTYKKIKKDQFAYGPVTSRNGDKISVALLEDHDEALISQAYTCFEIICPDQLLPQYLMMWFRRSEFDRYARFMSHGSAREIFGWEEMCNVTLPVPSIDKQREIVRKYYVLTRRIQESMMIIEKLEETARAVYMQWFIDFEFPDENGNPYKSSNGDMIYCKLANKEIPKGWKYCDLEETVSISRGASPRPIDDYMSKDSSGMPWVKIADATASVSKYISRTNEFISNEGIKGGRRVRPNTLILSNSASPGLPKIMSIEACVHDGWLIFADYIGISREYLFYYLLLNRVEIVSSSNGSIFNNLKTDTLKACKILIPTNDVIKKSTEIFKNIDAKIKQADKKHSCLTNLSEILHESLSRGE